MVEADEVGDYTGVGRHLRAAREAVGQQIADAARALRIGGYHLEALEAGRFADLPEAVYVHGFVRSYADYLKLDPDEMVRRVRLEMLPTIIPDILHFPAAPTDSPTPSRNLLLLALLLVVLVIGFWYLNYNFEPKPEQDGVLPEQTVQPAMPEPTSELATAPESAPEIATAPEMVSESPEIPPVDELVDQNPPATTVTPMEPQTAPVPAEAQEAQETTDAILAENIGTPEISPDATPRLDTPDIPDENVILAPSPPLKSETPPEKTAPPEQPEALVNAPVVLRASSDTWMQVSNANGGVLKSWVMRAGEQYVPPVDQAGLKVMVGNAGALGIFVDGVELPPLGAQGAVVRDLPLDAAGLKARLSR